MNQDSFHKEGQWPINPKTGFPEQGENNKIVTDWSALHEDIVKVQESFKKLEERRKFLEGVVGDIAAEVEQFSPNVAMDKLKEMITEIGREVKTINAEMEALDSKFKILIKKDIGQLKMLIEHNPKTPDA